MVRESRGLLRDTASGPASRLLVIREPVEVGLSELARVVPGGTAMRLVK